MKVLVINGPNLDMLGVREPEIYGKTTYADLVAMMEEEAKKLEMEIECFQSNYEGAIVEKLHEIMFGKYDGVIMNPGAFTHYSYAIYDALKMLSVPKIEVHISDVDSREDFRKARVTTPANDLMIAGEGIPGYMKALEKIKNMLL